VNTEQFKILSIGTWDLLHFGHLNIINYCKKLSSDVWIGVNSDEFVAKYKGNPPLMTFEERIKNIEMLGVKTVRNNSAGKNTIIEISPDILVIGSDWARKDYLPQLDVTQDELDQWDISILYVPYTAKLSTTVLKNRLKSQE